MIGNNNRAAFAVQPSIDKYGTLKFRPALGYLGTNTLSVYLKDSGTTIYGGVNTSDDEPLHDLRLRQIISATSPAHITVCSTKIAESTHASSGMLLVYC